MARPKLNLKDFFLRRGELVAMGVAGFILAALLIWSATTWVGAKDPDDIAKKLAQQSQSVHTGIAGGQISEEDDRSTQMPDWIVKSGEFKKAKLNDFQTHGTPFDPTAQPNTKRENPLVLQIREYQVDLTRSAMQGYDIIYDGEGKALIAVLTTKTNNKIDDGKLKNAVGYLKAADKRGKAAQAALKKLNQPQPKGMQPMGMQPGGPDPGGPGPGIPGGPPGRGGDVEGGSPYGGMAGGYDQSGQRVEKAIKYVPLDEIDEAVRAGNPPAVTVIPLRMITVHAVVPYKKQLAEIKRAGRFPTDDEAGRWGPWYDGFEVQRKVTRRMPDGKVIVVQDFPEISKDVKDTSANYKFEEKYIDVIDTRKIADHFDEGYLPYFLKPEMMLSMPLPQLAPDLKVKYPDIRLKEITDNEKKLADAAKPTLTPSQLAKQLAGSRPRNELYRQRTANESGAGGFGYAPGAFGGPDRGDMSTGTGPGPKGPTMPGPGVGSLGTPRYPDDNYNPYSGLTAMPEIENYLLRFVDCDVKPGYTYEYRIRLRMWNPNYGQDKLVANPEHAKDNHKMLWSKWTELNQPITVPAESFLYAFDVKTYRDQTATAYEKEKELLQKLQVKDSQAVVQVATWMEQVRTDTGGKREPVGSWVVAEMPVGRGEFVGRKQYVKLPLWSSETQGYVLREVTDKVLKGKDQPKGWLVDFSTRSVLVDFEGGKVRTRVNVKFEGNNVVTSSGRTVEEDAATEMLIVRPDGKLVVRNSQGDETDGIRKEVASKWTEWLKLVESRKTTTTPGMGDNPFDRPKGGGPGGSGN